MTCYPCVQGVCTEGGVQARYTKHLKPHRYSQQTMAKDNKVRMPSSMAGITQYYDGDQSKIMITPKHVMILIAGVAVIVLALHAFL